MFSPAKKGLKGISIWVVYELELMLPSDTGKWITILTSHKPHKLNLVGFSLILAGLHFEHRVKDGNTRDIYPYYLHFRRGPDCNPDDNFSRQFSAFGLFCCVTGGNCLKTVTFIQITKPPLPHLCNWCTSGTSRVEKGGNFWLDVDKKSWLMPPPPPLLLDPFLGNSYIFNWVKEVESCESSKTGSVVIGAILIRASETAA